MNGCRTSLRFKDDLLAAIEGEREMSQDTLANQGLVTKHGYSDANHRLLRTFGERQLMAQQIATRWLVSLLIN